MVRRTVLPSLLLCAGAFGDDAAQLPVSVGGFNVTPADGGLSAFDEHLVVHPKALIGGTYDSNVLGTQSSSPDVSARVLAGATAQLQVDEQQKAIANVEIERVLYRKYSAEDITGELASLDFQQQGLVAKFDAQAEALRQEMPLFETGELVKSQVYMASSTADYKGLYTNYGAELQVQRTDYLENSSLFTAAQGSHDDYHVGVRAGWDYARDANVFLHLLGTHTDYRDDSLYDDSYGGALRLGWSGPLGDKSTLRVEAGVGYRHYLDVDEKPPPYNQRNAYVPSLVVAMVWPWAEHSSMETTASSSIGDGVTSAAAWIVEASTTIHQELIESYVALLTLDVTQDRNVGAPAGGTQEVRTAYTVGLGCEHQLFPGLGVRLATSYLDSHSNSEPSYSRFQVSIDLASAY
jgi:hypothetical protein